MHANEKYIKELCRSYGCQVVCVSQQNFLQRSSKDITQRLMFFKVKREAIQFHSFQSKENSSTTEILAVM